MLDLIFWLVMIAVIVSAIPDALIWWKVYQWKRNMKRGFDNEWSTRQRSGGNDSSAG